MTSRSADGRRREPLPPSPGDEASRSESLSRLAGWFEESESHVLDCGAAHQQGEGMTNGRWGGIEGLVKKPQKALTCLL